MRYTVNVYFVRNEYAKFDFQYKDASRDVGRSVPSEETNKGSKDG